MGKRLSAAIVTGLVIAATVTYPASAKVVRTWGGGNTVCEDFLNDADMRSYSVEWSLGFVAALNLWFTSGTKRSVDFMSDMTTDDLESRLDSYCRENGLKTVYSGMTEIMFELMEKNAPKP